VCSSAKRARLLPLVMQVLRVKRCSRAHHWASYERPRGGTSLASDHLVPNKKAVPLHPNRGGAAVVITSPDGKVLSENRLAKKLLGDRVGRPCWQVVGDEVRGGRVACSPWCVQRMISDGSDCAMSHPVMIGQQRYQLSCAPVDGNTVSILAPLDQRSEPNGERLLTAREIDVLQLMAEGLTLGAAAKQLKISVTTVRTYVENVRRKFGVRTQGGLVAQGYELGYL
jgi:DNA-binding CsgD family transcriptional regulator